MTDGDSFDSSDGVTIREAVSMDERRLRQIALAAKAGWGYDQERVAAWVETLRLFAEAALRAEIYVAQRDQDLVAWMRLIPRDEGLGDRSGHAQEDLPRRQLPDCLTTPRPRLAAAPSSPPGGGATDA